MGPGAGAVFGAHAPGQWEEKQSGLETRDNSELSAANLAFSAVQCCIPYMPRRCEGLRAEGLFLEYSFVCNAYVACTVETIPGYPKPMPSFEGAAEF